tara:strand:- start:2582 stop:3649 length:1068 start_codon:yes stop_codon:yes gene_type:complete
VKFLNKKDQVIDLQLTQFGKRLLSTGQFKPTYYAFFDDGILYDTQYAGNIGKEIQNKTQERIISDTPQLQTQYVFSGIESKISKANEIARTQQDEQGFVHDPGTLEVIDQSSFFQSEDDRQYSLTSMLGTSGYNSDNMPSWRASFIHGKISGSANAQFTGSCSNQIVNIPEITPYDITYNTMVQEVPSSKLQNYQETDTDRLYGTQAIKVIERDSMLLLEIDEENTDFLNENFDIEVFKIEEEISQNNSLCSNSKKETLTPLYFIKKYSPIENGIIKDRQDILDSFGDELDLDETYVEYYFDILTDNEIPKDAICEYIKNSGNGIFSQRVIECEEFEEEDEQKSPSDLYSTDVDY